VNFPRNSVRAHALPDRSPLQDLRVLLRCKLILTERMSASLQSAAHGMPGAIFREDLAPFQAEELRRLAGETVTLYTYILELLDYIRRRDPRDFRLVYKKQRRLSAQEFSSLTKLAFEAICQLESLGEGELTKEQILSEIGLGRGQQFVERVA